jgi:hypothetical protein
MSQATLVDTRSTVPAMRPTVGSFRPIEAMMTTVTTNAEEIGFWSLMPSEMPLTIANTNTSSTASTRKPVGWPST